MKIIVEGKKQEEETYLFCCLKCGCNFEANNLEIKTIEEQNMDITGRFTTTNPYAYSCYCPNCNNFLHKYISNNT